MGKFTKIILFTVLSLVLVGFIGVAAVLWHRARQGNVQYQLAETAMERKDWPGAKNMLNRILAWDGNSEKAMRMMVEVAEAEGNPALEARWLGRLMKLNEFEKSYAEKYRRALLKIRDFQRFADMVDAMPQSSRTAADRAWRVYCAYMTRPLAEARRVWKDWKTTGDSGSEVARLLEASFSLEGKTVEEMIKALETLAASADESVRLEALLALGGMYISGHRLEDAERKIKAAVELDYYAGVPEMVRLHLIANRMQDAVALNGEYLRKFPTTRRAIEQAELLAAARRLDLLPGISALFNGKDYTSLALRNYLDAIVAYDRQNLAALRENMTTTRKIVRTPWSLMMSAVANASSTETGRFAALELDWKAIRRLAPFFDCRERVYAACKNAIAKALLSGIPATEVASLASALQNGSGKEDVELTRVLVLAGLQSGTATENDVVGAARRNPNDPTVLQLAAESSLLHGRPRNAMEYAERLRKTGTNETVAISLMMRSTFAMAVDKPTDSTALEAASWRMREMLTKPGLATAADCAACWSYVNHIRRKDDIELLKSASPKYAPFCNVMLLELEGKGIAALDALESIKTDDSELVFWCAERLARGDRNSAAIARYEVLPSERAEEVDVKINLSELYEATGDAEKAMRFAKDAFEKLPSHPNVQTCYARRLAERKEWNTIRNVIRMPADPRAASPMLIAAWVPAMENGIETDWAAERRFEARDASRLLLKFDSKNAVATGCLAKFESWQAERKKGK